MPQTIQPKRLKDVCIDTIINTVDTYWFPEKSDQLASLDVFFTNKRCRYLISPFHHLDDSTVDTILKSLYKSSRLNRYHLLVFLQSRLRRLDLSFVKKKNLINQSIAYYFGRNCFNLVELNLFAQTEISSKTLSYLLQWMRTLKKLDISHTKADLQVFQVLGKHCRQLECLYAESCGGVYDECLDLVCSKLADTIVEISMDNVRLTKECCVRALLTCKRLRHFYVNGLVDILAELDALETATDESSSSTLSFSLAKCFIDSDILLNANKMEALVRSAPGLRHLNINCIGPNSCLAYLSHFRALAHLVLANTASLISFKFGGEFLTALRDSPLGRQLKKLHLIHIVDVNLRSIAKHCPNLVKLNVEFLGYYEPAQDTSLTDQDNLLTIRSLEQLSISNVIPKLNQMPMNMGQFQSDLTSLVRNGRLKLLHLSGLHELTDEFFECLFSCRPIVPAVERGEQPMEHAYESIETLEMRDLNGISGHMIYQFLLDRANKLSEVNLHGCKHITRGQVKHFQHSMTIRNLDCKINWT